MDARLPFYIITESLESLVYLLYEIKHLSTNAREAIKEHPRGAGHVILHAALKMWGVCEGLRRGNPPASVGLPSS